MGCSLSTSAQDTIDEWVESQKEYSYGPPYTADPLLDGPPYPGALARVCNAASPDDTLVHNTLNEGADPRKEDPTDYYNTPLHVLCRHGGSPRCRKAARYLVRAGANVNTTNRLGVAPLAVVAMHAHAYAPEGKLAIATSRCRYRPTQPTTPQPWPTETRCSCTLSIRAPRSTTRTAPGTPPWTSYVLLPPPPLPVPSPPSLAVRGERRHCPHHRPGGGRGQIQPRQRHADPEGA